MSTLFTPGWLISAFSCLQIELMVCRFTNLPPIPPWGWQRSLVGFLLGAWPHAREGLLGRLFDWAEGGNYYARKRHALSVQHIE
jgi:hypothetical protein